MLDVVRFAQLGTRMKKSKGALDSTVYDRVLPNGKRVSQLMVTALSPRLVFNVEGNS